MRSLLLRAALGLGIGLAATAAASPETARDLSALSALDSGRWQIRDLDSGASQTLCVGDRRVLMQIRHGAAQCEWTVIRNEARQSTITYSCPNGSGRTAMRLETPRLAQIDSQGVLNGIPYGMRAEARRTGACR
ncbi:hypothetical protein IC614_05260 [Allosphingosinicella flava]|uniref:DUF3617 domain-containing protein n=1 Tax=Allosphingosinicella flava TaxID=2771430 RepID=A0A7T2LN47_9SPHN|nr:hypothetical protein [Sphingosinicella flava]QPQ55988.1 hypothetical protein IC614_05260 [Sphingosinicella flava]